MAAVARGNVLGGSLPRGSIPMLLLPPVVEGGVRARRDGRPRCDEGMAGADGSRGA